MNDKKKRDTNSIGFFNIARGVGIIFVIIYHSFIYYYPIKYSGNLFGNFWANIGAGLMVMFFIISGYSFFPKSMKKCVRIQAKLLLQPYYITVVFVLLAKLGLAVIEQRSFWQNGGQYIFSYLLAVNEGWEGTILGLKVDNVAMFWFFWSLFGGWIIFNAISRLKTEKKRATVVTGCVALGYLLTLVKKVWIYVFPNMLIVVGFLFIGYLMRKHKWFEKRNLTKKEMVLLLIPSFITLAFGGCDMYSFTWHLGVVDIIGSTCLGILFCRFFSNLSRMNIQNGLTEFLENVGFKTLQILCVHAFVEKVFPLYRLGQIFAGKKYFAVVVCFAIESISIFIGIRLIDFVSKVIRRNRKKGSHLKIVIDKEDVS